VQGTTRYLDQTTLVPPILPGNIVRIIDDFLGKSIFIRHSYRNPSGRTLYTVYGHGVPSAGTAAGADIDAEAIIATIAPGGSVPSHLHVSVAWVSDAVHPQDLDWRTMLDSSKVALINPLTVIQCPYQIIRTA